jgi:hypothetical protein
MSFCRLATCNSPIPRQLAASRIEDRPALYGVCDKDNSRTELLGEYR